MNPFSPVAEILGLVLVHLGAFGINSLFFIIDSLLFIHTFAFSTFIVGCIRTQVVFLHSKIICCPHWEEAKCIHSPLLEVQL